MDERETTRLEQGRMDESTQRRVYRGNAFDITALIALATGLLTLLTCASMGYMIYCMPVIPLALGIVGLATARKAVDPERTRLLSWIGLGSGGVFLLMALAFFVIWLAVVAAWVFIMIPFMMESGA
ncbi:MAG: hypothetical protein JW918_15270 [Anaerolineae bacterium]|nr:hypothetical protein [Anaerolineae bacterium]